MASRPTPEFWHGKRVFLTGHTGFKGSWACEMLMALGADVYGYSLAPDTTPALFDDLSLAERITRHQIGDIRDAGVFDDAIRSARPDVVLHMAAQPIVSIGYDDPIGTFETNIMGTAHLLQSLRRHAGDIPVLVVSSDKCYENNGDGKSFVESDPLGGKDPYSASKAGTEIVCTAFRESFFSEKGTPRLASGRAGNVVGGGDWSLNRLIPDLMRGFGAGTNVTIRRPNATRPWQHVLEPVAGYLVAIEAIAADRAMARAWNFGPVAGDVHTVLEVVEFSRTNWPGSTEVSIEADAESFAEASTLAIDSHAARQDLGWITALDFPLTLSWTVDWYSAYCGDPARARETTQAQLADYLALISRANS